METSNATFGPNLEVRASRLAGAALQIDSPDRGWTPLFTVDGGPSLLIDGWRAGLCVEFGPECRLLIIYHDSGVADVRVVNADFVTVSDLAHLTAEVDAVLDRRVSELAALFMRDIRLNLLTGPGHPAFAALRTIGDPLIAALASRAAPQPRLISCDTTASLSPTGRKGSVSIPAERLRRLLALFHIDDGESSHPWLVPSAQAGCIQAPALGQDGPVDAAYLVDRTGMAPTYIFSEAESGLTYYYISRKLAPNALYFPGDDTLVCASAADADEGRWRPILAEVDARILELASRVSEAPARMGRIALYTFGIPHLGHALWQELSAIDIYLSELAPAARPGSLYIVPPISGAELYGRLEELYPELTGHVVRGTSQADLLARAMNDGVGLVLISGNRIMQGPRGRIASAVNNYAAERKLTTGYRRLRDRPAGPFPWSGRQTLDKPLTIALGLRLSNRCPADAVGLYARLTHALRQRFGRLIVVIDGISGPDESGGATPPIYNGSQDGASDRVNTAQASETALDAEYAFVEQYSRMVRQAGLDIVSCIGRPMKENLFWLDQADFFVAPYGAGLAKVRWIYDKPGYVLLSRANQGNFDVAYLFSGAATVEPPFAPLYMSVHEEVEDLPLDPPRTEPPGRVYSVPHPENFVVNEAIVIPRIVDLVAAQRSPDAKASPAERRQLF